MSLSGRNGLAALAGRMALAAGVVAPLLAVQACSTNADGSVPGARRTGSFPNLNIPPKVATEQMSDEEAQSSRSMLNARREAIAEERASAPAGDRERLQRLAETHGQRTIDEIEN